MRTRRVMVVAVLLAAVAVALPVANAADTGGSPYPIGPGGRDYTPPPATYGTSVDADVPVRMSDGVVLKVDVVYPTDPVTGLRAEGPFPVLLTQDPYEGGATGIPGRLQPSVPGEYYVQRGYIYVHAVVRGTSRSEGEFDVFGHRSAQDGVELVYWAARLPGADGQVGLEGCSFLGINQLQAVAFLGEMQRTGRTIESPEGYVIDPDENPVKAMIPLCLSGDFYRDTFFDNGIPSGVFMVGAAGPLLIGVNTSHPLNDPNLLWERWFASVMTGGDIGFDRDYWIERDRVRKGADIARTGVPALLGAGWQEGGSIGALELYAVLQNAAAGVPNPLGPMSVRQRPSARYQVLVGNWGHGGGADPGMFIEWYDTWMRGARTGLDRTTMPIHLQELGASTRWISASTYPMVGTATPATVAPSSTPDQILWGPPGPGTSVTYQLGAPIPPGGDVTIAGPSAVRALVSSSNTDIQLLAELVDVAPDGSTVSITHGSILGSRLAQTPERSWRDAAGAPVRPFLTLDRDEYLVPGALTQLEIPLQPTVWRLGEGHQLALRLSSQGTAELCALNTKIGAAPTGCHPTGPMVEHLAGGVYTIFHDAERPLTAYLPLVPSGDLVTASTAVTPSSGGTPLPDDWR